MPEPLFSESEYRERIFAPMMAQVAPVNADGLLEEQWLNSRGAIARFDRGAIEIRVLDVQECPGADMAIASLVFATLRELVDRHGAALPGLARRATTRARKSQLLACARHGLDAPLAALDGLGEAFALPARARTAREFWRHVQRRFVPGGLVDRHAAAIETILRRGNLADRLLAFHRRHGGTRDAFAPMLRALADCLAENRMLTPAG